MADEYFVLGGLDEMEQSLTNIEREFFRNLDIVLTKLAEKVIEDARMLAPVLSGDLEAALDIDEVKTMLSAIYIDFGVVASPEVAPYAWAQHEGFRKTKTGKVVHFSPGEVTSSKGAHKGFMPGKKYLENAITINEKTIMKELATALKFGGFSF
ncbi:hypothetical protein KP77_25030 [Jeotgalibacillus alimentarius]|uniref:HK97 gp10 family phage protein n=1 Tax=Jeotgalibacillus alimentarius TaxID=135826 RepID=A0A0C2RYR2_9BACL|nr:hypothetical protein [Jeotgalibacillus alimentarius]KIL46934.1 hypothetical protein KP77_25030 [Jeotgalibacillus alimentarius]